MLRRSLICSTVVALALALVGSALAARVHVRIEGKSRTLAGATEPLVTPTTGTIAPPDGPDVTVAGDTALGALDRASRRFEVYYRVANTGFGPYVDRIGRNAAAGSAGWVFKVNGAMPPVGADQVQLGAGDRVLWYWADFSTGSPKTLALVRPSRNCFRAWEHDDSGARARATGVVFRVDGARVADADGAVCLGAEWRSVRVTKAGTIRSRVIRKPG